MEGDESTRLSDARKTKLVYCPVKEDKNERIRISMFDSVEQLSRDRQTLEPLTTSEMQIAQKMIDREHPVRDTPIHVTLPFIARYLKCCLCCCCLPKHVRRADPNDVWVFDPLQTALDV